MITFRRPRITEELRSKVVTLYIAGVTTQKIAERYHMSKSTIYKILRSVA